MKTDLFDLFSQNAGLIVEKAKELVNCESPSTDKSLMDKFGVIVANQLRELGADIKVYEQQTAGNHIRGKWGRGEKSILLLCHMDTVFDRGTVAQRPFSRLGDHLLGPGVLDMKASIAMALTAVRLLKQMELWPDRAITLLLTSDEEIGSPSSRPIIETEARQAEVVFCLEPALANGALKTARKGTGDINLRVRGVAAHAGVDHAAGRNAIEELAYHVIDAQKLTDYSQGTTVNVGVIQGGTRTNVVPDQSGAQVDFRVTQMEEYNRLERWVKDLTPKIEGTSISASILMDRPPMPRDERMIKTFQKAQAIASQMGLQVGEGSTGGGSDANFVAPLGIPVLDGLGAVGDGAHSDREFVYAKSLAERTALLAALLKYW